MHLYLRMPSLCVLVYVPYACVCCVCFIACRIPITHASLCPPVFNIRVSPQSTCTHHLDRKATYMGRGRCRYCMQRTCRREIPKELEGQNLECWGMQEVVSRRSRVSEHHVFSEQRMVQPLQHTVHQYQTQKQRYITQTNKHLVNRAPSNEDWSVGWVLAVISRIKTKTCLSERTNMSIPSCPHATINLHPSPWQTSQVHHTKRINQQKLRRQLVSLDVWC